MEQENSSIETSLRKWTFYIDYQREGKKTAKSYLWLEANSQEDAIQEAKEQISQIPNGKLGFMLRGWHDGKKCIEPY